MKNTVQILKKYLACVYMLFTLVSNETLSAQIFINEVMSSNQTSIRDGDGNFSDWIELYNSGNAEVDLTGMYLSDDGKKINKWTFPYVVIPAKGYLLIWASGKDKVESDGAVHTNFSISADGEPIILTDYDGTRLDSVQVPPMSGDQAYCRIPDGNINWVISTQSTPAKSNISKEQLSAPVFSQSGGVYSSNFTLTLSSAEPGAVIVYTLDGSDPDIGNLTPKTYQYKDSYRETILRPAGKMLEGHYQSNVYNTGIEVTDRSNEPNRIANIATTYNYKPAYFPKKPINKATVVKARAFKDGFEPSQIVTHSYIFREATAPPIPIISLSSNDTNMFDYNSGLLVPGVDFEKWRTSNPLIGATNASAANYNRRGEEYEYPMYLEMFDSSTKKKVFEQNLGYRVHGNFTRTHAQKSLRLYARKEYGTSSMGYDFFSEEGKHTYKRMVLRSYFTYRFGDTFFPAMVSHLKLDTQLDRPCIVYLNGEYYGVYEMKERTDKHYLNRKYDVDGDNIDLLENNQSIEEGDNEHYQSMISFIKSNTLSDNKNYQKVTEMMDIDNFIDYQNVQIYSANSDWPDNNIKFWRLKTEFNPDAPYGHDGRWRWILLDMDFAFGLNSGFQCIRNALPNAVGDGKEWSSLLLFNLLKNSDFKTKFLNRAADLMNTTFQNERLLNIINEKTSVIEPYIMEHIERWNDGGYDNWQDKLNRTKNFVQCRLDEQYKHYTSYFKLKGVYTIHLDTDDHLTDNTIKINTIQLDESTVGVAKMPYPWQGRYFSEIPVTISAIPAPGYVFSHWEGMPAGTPASFTRSFQGNTSLKAHFKPEKAFDLKYSSGTGGYLTGDTLQNISEGEDGTQVTAVPYEGYQFSKWSDGVTENPRKDLNVRQNINVQAIFLKSQIVYVVKYLSGNGGFIQGDTIQNISEGENGTQVTAVPYEGYQFSKWSDGVTENPRKDLNIRQNINVQAVFLKSQIIYIVKYLSGNGGFIQGDTLQNISEGENGTQVTAVPNEGYQFSKWSDGVTENPRKDLNVRQNINVQAVFLKSQVVYVVKYLAGNGGFIQGDTIQNISEGENGTQVTAIPNEGYQFSKWSDGVTENPRKDLNVRQNINVQAVFLKSQIIYVVKYLSGNGGFIQGDTIQNISEGENGTQVTAIPNEGYQFSEWSDGSAENPRTESNVQDNIEISALFSIITNQKINSTEKRLVYPNPTDQIINIVIEGEEIQPYRLYHTGGTFIQSGNLIPGKNVLDMTTFSSGLYLLEIISGQGSEFIKVMKF